VREVEKAYFSLLVLTASGGMGRSAATIYKKLASMLVETGVLFLLLISAIMCVRGHCSSIRHPVVSNVDLAFSEGKINIEPN